MKLSSEREGGREGGAPWFLGGGWVVVVVVGGELKGELGIISWWKWELIKVPNKYLKPTYPYADTYNGYGVVRFV